MEEAIIEKLNIKNDFRYEKKFATDVASFKQVEAIISNNRVFFKEIFQLRRVNNIYLDTPNLDYYHQGRDGTMIRKKVRIRWYGNVFGQVKNPILEIKFKNERLGNKWQFPINSFELSNGLSYYSLKDILYSSSLPRTIHDLIAGLRPTLLNLYSHHADPSFS